MVLAILFFPVTTMTAGHGSAPTGFFTTDILAEFDGVDDNQVYVGYHGRIYDLSDTFEDGSNA